MSYAKVGASLNAPQSQYEGVYDDFMSYIHGGELCVMYICRCRGASAKCYVQYILILSPHIIICFFFFPGMLIFSPKYQVCSFFLQVCSRYALGNY